MTGDDEETKKKERKLPEFIIIDERHEESFHEKEFTQEFRRIQSIGISYKLRVICALLACLSFLWAVGSFLCFAASTLIAAVCLYKVDNFNSKMLKFWKSLKRACVFTFALLLSVFSPYLGLGLIVMYFMMQDSSRNSPLGKILRSNLKDYTDRF